MKLMNMTITAMILFALSLTTAEASTRQVGGLIIGGGTGAIVGQAVGRTPESTIVGAAVGGVVGLIIGSELDRHHGAVNQPSQVVVYASAYNHRRGPEVRRHYTHRPQFHHKQPRSHYNQRKQFHHPRQNYRKTVVVEKGRHKTKRTVSITRGGGHRDHYQNNKPAQHNGRFHH